MMSGWKAAMVRRSCHHARGSSPISHAARDSGLGGSWLGSPSPEPLTPSPGLLHPREYAAECVELEGLLQERTAQLLEELQRVAADRVARGEDDAIGHRRMHAGECVEHLAPTQPGHSQIADDQVEWLHQRTLQRLAPVVGQYDLVTPAFERRLHVVEDVRLVINHEYAEAFLPLGWGRLALRTTGQRAALRADTSRQFHGEGRASAAARAARVYSDVSPMLFDDAQRDG